MNEREIGEVFLHRGRLLQVREGDESCTGCWYNWPLASPTCVNLEVMGKCVGSNRSDGKDVIFVEIEGREVR